MKFEAPAVNQARKEWWWLLFGLIIPLIICSVRAVPLLIDPGVPFDTQYTYLPLARMVIEDFPSLWKNELMLKTAPGAYFYMAAMNADIATIKAGNLAMSLTTLILLFDAAKQISGRSAAAACSWLYCLSPTLFIWTIYPMGEPLFILLSIIWIWSCIKSSQAINNNSILILIGGISLACATLTRGTYLYLIPLIILSSLVFIYKSPNKKFWKAILYMHILSILIIASYIAKNDLYFNYKTIASGTGNALYYGNNAMFYGQEPPFFGVSYDDFFVRGEATHLSIQADKKQIKTTKKMISDKTLLENLNLYIYKAGINLFFSSTHLKNYTDRAWRIILLALSIIAIAYNYKSKLIFGLVMICAYQWAVHIPVLYNPRYSIAAIDPTLTLLAACGIACLISKKINYKIKFTLITIIIGSILFGAWHQRYSEKLVINMNSMFITNTLKIDSEIIKIEGLNKNPINQFSYSESGKFSLNFETKNINFGELSILNFGQIFIDKPCSNLTLSYTTEDGNKKEYLMSLKGFKSGQNLSSGLTHIHQEEMNGKININFICEKNITIKIPQLEINEGGNGYQYRDKTYFP